MLNEQTKPELFDIVKFFSEENYETAEHNVEAEEGVHRFRQHVTSIAAKTGLVQRVIMVDRDDNTVMEWKHGEGLVFPPPPEGHEPAFKY